MSNPISKREMNSQFSKEMQMANKHEEMLNIVSHKGNANQNDIEIPSHPSHNGNHLENMLGTVVHTCNPSFLRWRLGGF
jgi:hypothetical protein